jgi:deoxyadenosine/deoxycytidine kinase
MFVAIEGNIGAGKSTLLQNLKSKYPSVLVCEENISRWNTYTVDETPILEAFYKDQKQHAFTLQMAILLSRIKTMMDFHQQDSIVFIERSMFADVKVFCKMLNESNTIISDAQLSIVKDWVDVFSKLCRIDMYIYLNVDVDLCMQRVASRNRQGETEISREYLTNLQTKHEEWFNKEFDTPILHIHNNDEETIDQILTFIEHHFPEQFKKLKHNASPQTTFPSITSSCRTTPCSASTN